MYKRSNVAAYMMLHYGLPYLAAAVESIYPQVDKIYIAYTAQPSQSWKTELPVPDTQDELKESVKEFMDKIAWVEGTWEHESEHCDFGRNLALAEHDWAVRFDSDEIFQPNSVKFYIEQAEKTDYQQWRMPFMHFWRSFDRVCRDASHPIRLERKTGNGLAWLNDDEQKYTVCHMGYAVPTKYIDYKMSVSGHKSEWRPDWYTERWLKNALEDVHPVCWNPPLWNTEIYDKANLPKELKKHAYYDKNPIE